MVIRGPFEARELTVGAGCVTVCVILAMAESGAVMVIIPPAKEAVIRETVVMAGLVM